MIGIAKAPATCGELVQGTINGINFLVTCPVNIYSTVTVEINDTGYVHMTPNLPKAKEAVFKTLKYYGMDSKGADVIVNSNIPIGKGMASSTADISSAIAATAIAVGATITPEAIAEISLSIEPTDGIMFPGITVFDHLSGKLCRHLGDAPDLDIVIVDLGGTVDTLSFNRKNNLKKLNKKKESLVSQALNKLECALKTHDYSLFGDAVTESSFAHQPILHKPELESLVDICYAAGGIGVNIAHSGTIAGLFFKPGDLLLDKLSVILKNKGFSNFIKTNLINGGIEVLRNKDGDNIWASLITSTGETYEPLRRSMG